MYLKKCMLLLAAVVMAKNAFALPVLNQTAATNDLITVYPDSTDKNLYYIAPRVMEFARDRDGVPQFSYVEYRDCFFCRTRALVQSVMVIGDLNGTNGAGLRKGMDTVKAGNPQARFAPLPVVASEVSLDKELGPVVVESNCNHAAGTLGSEQTCDFILSSRGKDAMRALLQDAVAITLNYNYTVEGVTLGADGKYTDAKIAFAVAGALGSLRQYPQLFRDMDGNMIPIGH